MPVRKTRCRGTLRESHRYRLRSHTDGVWHGVCAAAAPGTIYGYRVYGPHGPGLRFEPERLALDPCARGLAADPNEPAVRAAGGPPAIVQALQSDFDWSGDGAPRTPWSETVVYEAHVKGLTATRLELPEAERGTFAGLASDAMLEHYRELGVTALELLPLQQRLDEAHLVRQGLTNYWGYNTIAFFVPDERFRSEAHPGDAAHQLKAAIYRLHQAGIEVILDVVFNHTGEGGVDQPASSQRLIDNRSYYRLDPADPDRYADVTGCGNTINAEHPRVVQWIMDCLRYWVQEFHVDGFRFDLATALGRRFGDGFDPRAPLFAALLQDPELARVKLIAEPWDPGEDGYQGGRFPEPFFEWNDDYRDTLRRYWRGDPVTLRDTAACLAGSSDRFARRVQGVPAGINYITAHDGFTLNDLVSYNEKHNEANGEDNRDGHDTNYSRNYGREGPPGDGDFELREIRRRQTRNFMATLFLSRGVPMLQAGDEFWRTQAGNNNAYCQDNPNGWLDWDLDEARCEFRDFVRDLIQLRRECEIQAVENEQGVEQAMRWFLPDGTEPASADWSADHYRSFGVILTSGGVPPQGHPRSALLALFNAGEDGVHFHLPQPDGGAVWERKFDTVRPGFDQAHYARPGGEEYRMQGRSVAAFVRI